MAKEVENEAAKVEAQQRRVTGIEAAKVASLVKSDPDPGIPVLLHSTGETRRTGLKHGQVLARKLSEATARGSRLQIGGPLGQAIYLEEVRFHPDDKAKAGK